jgi:hypothetical protein
LGVFSNASSTPPKISESDNSVEVSCVKDAGVGKAGGEGGGNGVGNEAALFRSGTAFSDAGTTPREAIAAKGTSC